MLYDVIIVGAGAAGMTAAIYTTRREMKTLLITQDIGGQASTTPDVENFPGFEKVDGLELMQKFQKQAQSFGAEFAFEEVKAIQKDGQYFHVVSSNKEYDSKTIILCFGLTHRHLGVDGEEEHIGKGVSYCATCDAPLFRNKDVAVVGGGSAALDAALLLSKIAKKVYLIHRRDEFRGEEILVERLKSAENIEAVYNSKVKKISGNTVVESLTAVDVKDEAKEREIKLNGIFVEIGFQVRADLVKGLVELDDKNQIIISKNNETSVPGIFAAGDVTDIIYKQIIISAGEGAKAALQAYKYLNANKAGGVGIDWGIKNK
ncbi:MAG: thioredoxin-disulfide reductase [Patescibacteria group bacterium]|jgi:thioredoxin reductase (NADPH)